MATSNQDVEELLAMARYDRDPATGLAEVALVVRDEWHGRGVGSGLFVRLIGLARAQGVRGFTRAGAREQWAHAQAVPSQWFTDRRLPWSAECTSSR